MLKHFVAATLGFAVLFGAIGHAAADKIRHHWIDRYDYPYAYSDYGQPSKYATRRSQSQPNVKLDFETEAVWRNLRPECFDSAARASLNRAAWAVGAPARPSHACS
jgi:hypothetical protein